MGQLLIPGLIAIGIATAIFLVLKLLLKNRGKDEVFYGLGILIAAGFGFWFGNLLSFGACGFGFFGWVCRIIMYPISMVGFVLIFYWVTRPKSREL